MPQKPIRQALNEALHQEMRRDPTIITIGENVAGGVATEGQREEPLPFDSAFLTDVYVSY